MDSQMIDFESAMLQLDEIMSKMANNDITLNKSIEYYATAADLILLCKQGLDEAKLKVEEIDLKMKEYIADE